MSNLQIFSVRLNVECLPGIRCLSKASLDFSDEDIARRSLEHVRETYPDAELHAESCLDPSGEMLGYFTRVRQRTEELKKAV